MLKIISILLISISVNAQSFKIDSVEYLYQKLNNEIVPTNPKKKQIQGIFYYKKPFLHISYNGFKKKIITSIISNTESSLTFFTYDNSYSEKVVVLKNFTYILFYKSTGNGYYIEKYHIQNNPRLNRAKHFLF